MSAIWCIMPNDGFSLVSQWFYHKFIEVCIHCLFFRVKITLCLSENVYNCGKIVGEIVLHYRFALSLLPQSYIDIRHLLLCTNMMVGRQVHGEYNLTACIVNLCGRFIWNWICLISTVVQQHQNVQGMHTCGR